MSDPDDSETHGPRHDLDGRVRGLLGLPGEGPLVKVLVIDDEPLLRDLLGELLELLGHEADLAADGHEGLARFDPCVHQVVLDRLRHARIGWVRGGRRHSGAGLRDADCDDQRTRGASGSTAGCRGGSALRAKADHSSRSLRQRWRRSSSRLGALGAGPVPHATFRCPLSREVGRVVTLEAVLAPAPPPMIVTDLQGLRTRRRSARWRAGAQGGVGADRGRAGRGGRRQLGSRA